MSKRQSRTLRMYRANDSRKEQQAAGAITVVGALKGKWTKANILNVLIYKSGSHEILGRGAEMNMARILKSDLLTERMIADFDDHAKRLKANGSKVSINRFLKYYGLSQSHGNTNVTRLAS